MWPDAGLAIYPSSPAILSGHGAVTLVEIAGGLGCGSGW
jgi:hypothetical protein